MTKMLLSGIGVAALLMVVAWVAAAPNEKVKAGESVQPMKLINIHGAEVNVPSGKSKWVHLQFRRFAGCPICNLHLQSFVQRNAEIESAGIHEVVFFHSPNESLLPYQGSFPFDVIGDPEKKFYGQFGVGTCHLCVIGPASLARDRERKHRLKTNPKVRPRVVLWVCRQIS